MATRRPEFDKARGAYTDGLRDVGGWLLTVPADRWAQPSVLPSWTVAELGAHLIVVADSVAALVPSPAGTAAQTVGEYVANYRAAATDISNATQAAAALAGADDATGSLLREAIALNVASARDVLLTPGDTVVQARRGPIRLIDYLATRAVEIAVHADDLARSMPDLPPPEIPRDATRLAVRTLLDALAEKAPGRAVEVRVPPFAAVQCVPGPRHTRGTPSNVVEMDATTWLRLAAGRERWPDAAGDGRISASGDRANISDLLPLFE